MTLHPGSDLPFWSLNYEVWYYIVFGAAVFLRGRTRAAALIVAGLLAGPKILLLLPVWLMGVAVWRWRTKVPPRIGPILCLAGAAAFLALEAAGGQALFWHADTPWLADRYSPYDYIASAFVALFILGLASSRLPTPGTVATRAIRWLSGASFGLYLLHYPLLRFYADVLPGPLEAWSHRLLLFALALGTSIALARLIERQKDAYRTLLSSALRVMRAKMP